jgi:hypothetical protein
MAGAESAASAAAPDSKILVSECMMERPFPISLA